MKLLYGCDEGVARWVSLQIMGYPSGFKDCTAIGVIDSEKIIAGVVYSGYTEGPNFKPITIEMSVASIDKRWCNRHNLRAFFAYPFIQLGLERVQTLCSANNEGVIMFNKRLGFTREGLHRKAWPLGGDAISWSMLKEECKWF